MMTDDEKSIWIATFAATFAAFKACPDASARCSADEARVAADGALDLLREQGVDGLELMLGDDQ